MPKTTLAGIFTRIKRKKLNFVFLLQVFFVLAILVFGKTRFFRNLGSFAKLRNSRSSSLIFAKHENHFIASFAKFSQNKISSKTLAAVEDVGSVYFGKEARMDPFTAAPSLP
jgi:hypothetical protein